jgi:hypothetical protein
MKVLGGRLSDSGSRSGHICDGPKATRVIARGNATNSTGLGNPVAQQAAHADKQQSPVQFRSEAGGIPVCFHCVFCNDSDLGNDDADLADRPDS